MKNFKKLLCTFLSVLMILSSVTAVLPAMAAVTVENGQTSAPSYTAEELKELSQKYAYDLTEEEISEIVNGEVTLSDITKDREEPVTLIVQLSGKSVLEKTPSAVANGVLTKAAVSEQRSIEKQQAKVQSLVEDRVFEGEEQTVLYSYTLIDNAYAITARASQIDAIAAIPGVESVYTAPVYAPVPTDAETLSETEYADNYYTGSDNTTNYTGEGTAVAIIDTGLDIEHDAFMNDVENPKIDAQYISGVFDDMHVKSVMGDSVSAEDMYYSSKIPFTFNYSDSTVDVSHYNDDEGDHGTHVAGITAGYAVNEEGAVLFSGVAPQAQIVVMKVFGKNRAGNYADILAAVEDAVLLGVDAINLSLGSWAGFTYAGDYPALDAVYENASNAGIVVSCAAGNDYTSAHGNLYKNDLSLASNPDNGIVNSPATYDDNLAVASVASKDYYANCISIGGRNVAYTCNATDDARNIERYTGQTFSYAVLKDGSGNMLAGSAGDFENFGEACGISGKFVVVKRGLTFTQTAQLAQANGAVGLIVCDNVNGSLVNMAENVSVSIPSIFVSRDDGAYILSNESTDNSIFITAESAYVTNPGYGVMSDFSSWGVTSDLKLKPEITAYGGAVYSTRNENTYGLMSGTSMATPYITGVAALIAQHYNAVNKNNPEAAGEAKKNFAVSMMMSTANPVIEATTGVCYSPRKQGAGLVNIDAALASNAYITVDGSATPKIDFGDDKNKTGSYDLTFNIVNTSAAALTFGISSTVQTEAVTVQNVDYVTKKLDSEKAQAYIEHCKEIGKDFSYVPDEEVYEIDNLSNVKFMSGLPYDLTSMSSVTTDKAGDTVTVSANGSVSVTVSVVLGSEAKAYMDENFVNGIYVEGFIKLTSMDSAQPDLTVPYMGFYGDWTKAPVIDDGTWEQELSGEDIYPQMGVSSGNRVFSGLVGLSYTPLGTNDYCDTPFFFYYWNSEYRSSERNIISSYKSGGSIKYWDDAAAAVTSLLRNARYINYKVTDAVTGEVYADKSSDYVRKSYYYNDTIGVINAGYYEKDTYVWQGTDAAGHHLPAGTEVIYTVTAGIDYGDGGKLANTNNSYSFNVIIDGEKPVLSKASFERDADTGDVIFSCNVKDDNYVSDISYTVVGYSASGSEVDEYIHNVPVLGDTGVTVSDTLNISEVARKCGMVRVRCLQVGVKDWVSNAGSGCYGGGDYMFPLYDHLTLVSDVNLLPVDNYIVVKPTYTYGYAASGTSALNPQRGNLDDFGIDEGFIFTSSAPEVATVSPAGIVTGIAPGYAVITVETQFGAAVASFRLRVTDYKLQRLIDNAEPGSVLNYTGGDIDESVSVNKNITIDLGGAKVTGLDGFPSIQVVSGNVTITNGSLASVYSADSENPLLTDILSDCAPAVKISGGNVTLKDLSVTGAKAEIDGDMVLAGSAVTLSYGADLTVDNSDLTGMYAVNNALSGVPGGGNINLISGNLEGILGSVSVFENVTVNESSTAVDVTNTLAGKTLYDAAESGTSYSRNMPSDGIFISAKELSAAEASVGSSLAYDAEKDVCLFNINSSGAKNNYCTQYIKLNQHIDADKYRYAVFTYSDLANAYCYSTFGTSDKDYFTPEYSNAFNTPQAKDAANTIVFDLGQISTWSGQLDSIYFWPYWSLYSSTPVTVKLYDVAFFSTSQEAEIYATGQAVASATNLKVVGAQTFSSKLSFTGSDLHVDCSFPDFTDGSFSWTPETLKLYEKVSTGEYTYEEKFVSQVSINAQDGSASAVFNNTDPSKNYTVHAVCSLALNSDNTSGLYKINETEVLKLVSYLPQAIEDCFGIEKIRTSLEDYVTFLMDYREGCVERDARHYDCPLTSRKVPTNYPEYDKYPDIIGQGVNNSFSTWTAYYDGDVIKRVIGNHSGSVSDSAKYFGICYMIARILGDAKMNELMADLRTNIPESVYNTLDENYRVGNYGFSGSLVTYDNAIAELTASLENGASASEKLTNALEWLSTGFEDILAGIIGTRALLWKDAYPKPGVYYAPLCNRATSESWGDSYVYKYNDRIDEFQSLLTDILNANNNMTNGVKALSGSYEATGLMYALSNYNSDDAQELVNIYFSDISIPDSSASAGKSAEFVSAANYDGYIYYVLGGGINNSENPGGYSVSSPCLLKAPSRQGYSFGGWYTSSDYKEGTEFTSTSALTDGDITVYAKWNINTYAINYYSGSELVDSASYVFNSDTAVSSLIPAKAGCAFRYWYADDENTPFVFGKMPAENVNLHAKYSNIGLSDVDKTDNVYSWQYPSDTPVGLVITEDCVIDFGGRTITDFENQPMITVKNGAVVTIANAVFAPVCTDSVGASACCIYATGGAKVTVQNCIVSGKEIVRGANRSYAGSAVCADNASIVIAHSVVKGLYAVNNKPGYNVITSPGVSVINSILIGEVSACYDNTVMTGIDCEELPVAEYFDVLGVDAAEKTAVEDFAAERVFIFAETALPSEFTCDYNGTDTLLTVNFSSAVSPVLPDSSAMSIVPCKLTVNSADYPVNGNTAEINNITAGNHAVNVSYKRSVTLSADVRNDIVNLYDSVASAALYEAVYLDEMLSDYDDCISVWNSNKGYIKDKFMQQSNSLTKALLEDIRICLEKVGGNDYTGTQTAGKGLIPEITEYLAEYRAIASSQGKINWLINNKQKLTELTLELNSCFTDMSAECASLNGLSIAYVGTDYSEKLGYVQDITDRTLKLRNKIIVLPVTVQSEANACAGSAEISELAEMLAQKSANVSFAANPAVTISQNDIHSEVQTISVYSLTYSVYDEYTGQTDTASEYHLAGEAISAPSPEDKTGRTFSGWSDTVPTVMPAENVYLTGTYTLDTYTLTFRAEGNPDIIRYASYGDMFSDIPQIPSREHYTATAPYWDCNEFDFIASDMIITAVYTIDKMTVTFVAGGNQIKQCVVPYGSALTEIPAIPAVAHYTDTAPVWDVTDFSCIVSDMTVSAVYTPDVYTVKWNNGVSVISEQYSYGDTPVYSGSTPVKAEEGRQYFTFDGWSPEICPADSDITYTAVFSAHDIVPLAPDYTVPQSLTAVYGQHLGDIALPYGFAWTDAELSVGNAGINSFTVTYTPADLIHYHAVEKIRVSVNVDKAYPEFSIPQINADKNKTLSEYALPAGFAWNSSDTVLNDTGEQIYTATYTPADTDNYRTVTGVEITVHVSDPSEGCTCICHSTSGIKKLFYKFMLFFWKLFKINQYCDCGVAHY